MHFLSNQLPISSDFVLMIRFALRAGLEKNIKTTAKFGKVSRAHAQTMWDVKCYFGTDLEGKTIPLPLVPWRKTAATQFLKNTAVESSVSKMSTNSRYVVPQSLNVVHKSQVNLFKSFFEIWKTWYIKRNNFLWFQTFMIDWSYEIMVAMRRCILIWNVPGYWELYVKLLFEMKTVSGNRYLTIAT